MVQETEQDGLAGRLCRKQSDVSRGDIAFLAVLHYGYVFVS